MRIYNGTNSQLDLPLSGIQRITIPAKSVSGDIMPSTEFLSLLVGSYDYSEIALIVSGPFEINMCAGVSGSVGFVVQSLEEAIERFAPKPVVEEPKCCECNHNPCTCGNSEEPKNCCEEDVICNCCDKEEAPIVEEPIQQEEGVNEGQEDTTKKKRARLVISREKKSNE